MRLLINTSLLRFGGAVQVALSVIRECIAFDDHEYHVVLGPGVGKTLDRASFPSNFHFYDLAFGVMGLGKVFKVHRQMSVLENQIKPDCILTTSGPAFWKSRAPHVMGFNRPLYIYPESPYVKALQGRRRLRLKAIRMLHAWFYRREADAFIVQTDDVNQRIRQWFGTKNVHTVTNNHSSFFLDSTTCPARMPPPERGVFRFLTVTSYYHHKNLEIIPEVLEQLQSSGIGNVEFVLTLTPEEFQARIGSIPEGIRLVGSVPPNECPALYKECHGMFLPTLAECFSASYPEAMVMRKPIVTTDLGFARSICGPAAVYFQACDAVEATRVIADLMRDTVLQSELVCAGEERLHDFDSPSERAMKILSVCEGLSKKGFD